MKLTKILISKNLSNKFQITSYHAKNLVRFFFEELSNSLEKGEYVKISGLGKFILKDKGERLGRNPKSGENFLIKSRRVVIFKSVRNLKIKFRK